MVEENLAVLAVTKGCVVPTRVIVAQKKASCKNKERSSDEADPQNTDAGQNAFERHQIAMEKAKQQISVSVFHIHNTTNINNISVVYIGLILYTRDK